MRQGLYDVVKASLTGSIPGNALLVLGLAITLGGFRYREQHFNQNLASFNTTLLFIAATALVVLAVFHSGAHAISPEGLTMLSLLAAIVLICAYGASLI